MELLVVEDDAVLGRVVQRELNEAGYQCEWARNGSKGLEQARAQKFDAILLDLMLPDMSGMELLRQLRGAGILTPVIVLSAMSSVDERVSGLNAGADDYLVKPFSIAELTARLTAVCRRSLNKPSTSMKVGPLDLDLTTRRVSRNEQEIDLTPTEFSMLEFLMRYHGQVVTRKMLCEHLWESDWEGATNVIEVHINRLRSKIDKGFDEPMIHTVRGRGYTLRGN
ncbi:MAG: response regulator transcription factor [Planctomycetaceae bacterium]|nr:response regulator transcription factor [Planctomycetaceae bacterium]